MRHSRDERWLTQFRHGPVLYLDVRDYDLLTDPDAVEDIAARVRAELEGELPQTELWPAVPRRRALV